MAPKGYKLSPESRAKITGRPISSNEPSTVHMWLTKHHQKMGICEECEKVGRTDWAYLHHPKEHTRNRADYLELCRKCHRRMDDPIYKWSEQVQTIKTPESLRAGQRASVASRLAKGAR